MKKILIPTVPEDHHAFAVAHALRLKGAEPILWFTSDFPTQAIETVRFRDGRPETEIRDFRSQQLATDVHSLWNRRPREELNAAALDPADSGFARIQCSRFRTAFLNILCHDLLDRRRLCVNPWESALRTENKLWQHHLAAQAGLEMPESVYTNDPSEIRRFLAKQGGMVAYKPFLGALWDDGTTSWGYYTSAISKGDLVEDELLQAVPGIYQELVPKAYELRVTMIGQRAFTARLNSQQTNQGQLDWRRAYEDLKMEPWDLPEDVKLRCLDLMRKLDIVFGCFDFIVTPDGRHVFLEVNQAGQFLFIEESAGIPLLDAFSEFLIQGRTDFDWEESETSVRLPDIADETFAQLKQEIDRHVPTSAPKVEESRRV